MKSEILIAGAGHGGLLAGAHLAKKGFKVALFEQQSEVEIGYDWTDDFSFDIFQEVGLPVPSPEEVVHHPNVTFISPNMASQFETDIPDELREIGMERKLLYKKLIAFARAAGVEMHFGCKIVGPQLKENIVTGLMTASGPVEGALVVDAAGINSPVRTQLPAAYGIPTMLSRGEVFFAYRAFYNLTPGVTENPPTFKTYLKFNGIPGIAWFRSAGKWCDVLFGSIDTLNQADVDALFSLLKRDNPLLGAQVMRGGIFCPIPVRRPFPMFVGPNYAAVGDSACMTRPINGSGIDNAFRGGNILAEVISSITPAASPSDSGVIYSTAQLWPYQVRYYQTVGGKMVGLDYLKCYLLSRETKHVNWLFGHSIITAKDLTLAMSGKPITLGFRDLVARIVRGISRMDLLVNLKSALGEMVQVEKIGRQIPMTFDPGRIDAWRAKLERKFAKFKEMP